jgi:hypothetical protein
MAWNDVTSSAAVLKAIQEYDRLGREEFLEKYGYGPAREYYIEYEGRFYDSKAILGVAHGYQFPQQGPLDSRHWSGGKSTVERLLSKLGFSIVRRARIAP